MNRVRNVAFVVVAAAALGACATVAGEAEGQEKGPGKHGAARFEAMDTDTNGTVSVKEFTAAHEKRMAEMKARMGDKWDAERAAKRPSAEEQFKKADANGDGALTKEELRQARQEGRKGRGKGGETAEGDKAAD